MRLTGNGLQRKTNCMDKEKYRGRKKGKENLSKRKKWPKETEYKKEKGS